jgi:hypothetical protein
MIWHFSSPVIFGPAVQLPWAGRYEDLSFPEIVLCVKGAGGSFSRLTQICRLPKLIFIGDTDPAGRY